MLMAHIAEKHPEGVIVGRDAQNTVRREHVSKVLHDHRWLKEWVDLAVTKAIQHGRGLR